MFFGKIERRNQGRVNSDWYKLSQQADLDMFKTKNVSGYLIDPEKG